MPFCGECGSRVSDTAKFCVECGSAVVSVRKAKENGSPTTQRVVLTASTATVIPKPKAPATAWIRRLPRPVRIGVPAILVLAFVLVFVLFPLRARVITISELEGSGATITDDNQKEENAEEGDRLFDRYVLSTGRQASATMNLDDKSMVKMDADTIIRVLKSSQRSLSIHVEDGAIAVHAVKQRSGQSIEIQAGNTVLGVRGTFFVVSSEGENVTVDLFEGRLNVRTPEKRTDLNDGYHISVTKGEAPVVEEIDYANLSDFARKALAEYEMSKRGYSTQDRFLELAPNFIVEIQYTDESGRVTYLAEHRTPDSFYIETDNAIVYVDKSEEAMYSLSKDKTGIKTSLQGGMEQAFEESVLGIMFRPFENLASGTGWESKGSEKIAGRNAKIYEINSSGFGLSDEMKFRIWIDEEYGIALKYVISAGAMQAEMEITRISFGDAKKLDLSEYQIQDYSNF